MKRVFAMVAAGLLLLGSTAAVSAGDPGNSNQGGPCQGQANPGCSGPGKS